MSNDFPVTPRAASPTSASLYELSWKWAMDGKMVINIPSGSIIDCNPAAEALTRKPRAELIGCQIADFVPPRERPAIIKELHLLTAKPGRYENFHLLQNAGRDPIPILIASSGLIRASDGSLIAICEFQDISQRREQEHRLATKRWALSAYAAAVTALSQQHSQSGMLEAICEAIVTEPTYALAWVGIARDSPGMPIQLEAKAGPAADIMEGIQISWSEDDPSGRGPAPTAIRSGQVNTTEDLTDIENLTPWIARARDYGVCSCAAFPFSVPQGATGALVVCATAPKAFEQVALEMFTHLAEQLAHGIRAIQQEELLDLERRRSAEADRRVAEAMSLMIEPMSLAMEMRDPYTAGHQNRVAEIAGAIATEMGLPAEQVMSLRLAAQVHDIGKMSVPTDILSKPRALTKAERTLLAEHCTHGYNVLKGIPFPWPIATIVLQHHEKLDGSGYPQGLKGDEILPEARIMTVADMFEAMISHRPYRPGIAPDLVIAELHREAGIALDAGAVHTCASLYRRGRFDKLFA